jgi:hypothetical protein
MGFYAIKPAVVQAFQNTDENSVKLMMDAFGTIGFNNSTEAVYIDTGYEFLRAKKGEWVVKPTHGKMFVCDDETFKLIYQSV